MRVKTWIAYGICVAFVLAGCGSGEQRPAPDVVGERLDVAQERLDDRGLGYETIGGGAFGVLVTSRWTVCEQRPAPGRPTSRVELVVDRWCPPPAPVVPSVERLPLAEADERLRERGIEPETTWLDEADWFEAIVCEQHPPAGERAATVELRVGETCVI
jgi:beta-lactam-binding protein with PASTA domain